MDHPPLQILPLRTPETCPVDRSEGAPDPNNAAEQGGLDQSPVHRAEKPGERAGGGKAGVVVGFAYVIRREDG